MKIDVWKWDSSDTQHHYLEIRHYIVLFFQMRNIKILRKPSIIFDWRLFVLPIVKAEKANEGILHGLWTFYQLLSHFGWKSRLRVNTWNFDWNFTRLSIGGLWTLTSLLFILDCFLRTDSFIESWKYLLGLGIKCIKHF